MISAIRLSPSRNRDYRHLFHGYCQLSHSCTAIACDEQAFIDLLLDMMGNAENVKACRTEARQLGVKSL